MLGLGLRLRHLGTERLRWRDLLVVVRHSPAGCAVQRSKDPKFGDWTTTDMLLRYAVDLLAAANWMASKDGADGVNRPKPFPGPGVPEDEGKPYGAGGVGIDELDEFLGWD